MAVMLLDKFLQICQATMIRGKWQIALIFSSNRSYFISTDRPLIHSCHSFVYATTNLLLVVPYAYMSCFTRLLR